MTTSHFRKEQISVHNLQSGTYIPTELPNIDTYEHSLSRS